MILNLNNKYENCTNCINLVNNIVFEIDGNVFINDIIFKKTSIYNIHNDRNNLYFNDKEILYQINSDLSLTEIFRVKEADSVKVINNNIRMAFKRISRKELLYKFYNCEYKELWCNKADQWVDVLNDKFVKLRNRLDVDEKNFTIRNISNGFPLWSYSLPEGFKISSLAQIIDNLLFFDAFKNANEEHFIVGLDINTGKIVWQHLYKIPYKEDIIAFTFNQKNKLCYAYLGNWYQIFNPISGEIIFEKKFDNDIDPYVNSVCDDKLWFVIGKYENCKFGYINLITNEIEFLQDFPQENDEIFDTPIFHQNKLYLRGKYYNNLYIFEE